MVSAINNLNNQQTQISSDYHAKTGHFTKEEWFLSGGGKITWFGAQPLLSIPISILENLIANEEGFLRKLAKDEKQCFYFHTYICRLAFFERIELPLEYVLKNTHTSTNKFPISDAPNFQAFTLLVDKHYSKLFNALNTNESEKKLLTDRWTLIILKLWLGGYGILPGYGRRVIDNEVIETIFKLSFSWKGKEKPVRLLAKLLEHERESPINKPKVDKRYASTKDFFELEKDSWDNLLERYGENGILLSLSKYVFSELKGRTEGHLIREYTDQSTKNAEIDTLSPLSPSSWRTSSKNLQKYFLVYCSDYSIADILTEEIFHNQLALIRENESRRCIPPIHHWLDWLIKVEGHNANLKKLVPKNRKRRRNVVHGKILNPVAVTTLIDHLVNQPANFTSENRTRDYRCRRICLLMLSTGARLSQSLCLKYDCIQPDKFGNKHIVFHKVKGDKPYTVWCDDELLAWIEELKKFAPKKTLYYPEASDKLIGDNLDVMRLFANDTDDGPLTKAVVQTWLKDLQKKIWSNNEHPNGRYFSPHDLRRMQATYLKICGFSEEAIQVKLGQSDINSQIPYTATGDPRNADDYAKILEDDIYGVERSVLSNDSDQDTEINKLYAYSTELSSSANITEHWLEILTKAVEMTKDDTITSGNDVFAPTLTATGNPLFISHCGSPGHYNCGSSPIYCLSCNKHKADEKNEADYKALLLRQMVSCLHHEYLANRHMLTGYREAVYEKVDGDDGLKKTIEKAAENVFINGLNFSTPDAKKIYFDLWKLAKHWYKTHSKELVEPILNHEEAISMIKTKEVL